jgi:hypothetical protein
MRQTLLQLLALWSERAQDSAIKLDDLWEELSWRFGWTPERFEAIIDDLASREWISLSACKGEVIVALESCDGFSPPPERDTEEALWKQEGGPAAPAVPGHTQGADQWSL